MMAKCDCYYQHGMKFLCYGTKEMEECSCGGDTSKCDFYPEKRSKKTQTMANEKRLIDANALQRKICGAKCGCEYEDCGCEGDCQFDFFISNATTVESYTGE